MEKAILYILSLIFVFPIMGCSSSNSRDDRSPASYSRAGREYREPRAMNHRRMDSDAIFSACMRERSELYCRNRIGR